MHIGVGIYESVATESNSKWVTMGYAHFLDIYFSYSDFILKILQSMNFWVCHNKRDATIFISPGWFSEGGSSFNCPVQSVRGMQRTEVWKYRWSIHPVNVLSPEKIYYLMSCM